MLPDNTPSAHGDAVSAMPDPQYVERVAGRVQRIERAEITTRQDIDRSKEEYARAVGDIDAEVALLRKELAQLDTEVASVVERVKHTILLFKTVVKRGDMLRLQTRMDMWAPETRISRDQFSRMLRDRIVRDT